MRTAAILIFLTALFLQSSFFAQTAQPSPVPRPAEDISGMYSFLQDGEFVQITVEDAGRVTGFISRYGDSDGDHGAFLNQFFKAGKIEGDKLTFTTETVHAVWYEFSGTVEHPAGKNPGDEGYRLLRGTLTESRTDADKKASTTTRNVGFKSFPQDAEAPAPKPD
jgi:hypothetical protein